MTERFDLIVVGGGPAGNSAAITAARAGCRVILLERGRVPRHKVCGEFVSAESIELLRWLLGSQSSELTERAIWLHESRLHVDGRTLRVPVNPPGASTTRYDLDLALWNAARSNGVTTLAETVVQEITPGAPFRVVTTAGEFSSRAVINASGRWSNLTRPANGHRKQRWLGMKAHCRGEMDAAVDLYFFGGGYCGVQPVVPAGQPMSINICALIKPGVADSIETLVRCHPLLEAQSRSWATNYPALRTFPVIFRQPATISGSILNVGDAANFVDPFVGDGIAIALRGGHMGATHLARFLHEKCSLAEACRDYARAYTECFAGVYQRSSILRKLIGVPRLLRTPFLRACERNPRLAEYLVKATRSRVPVSAPSLAIPA